MTFRYDISRLAFRKAELAVSDTELAKRAGVHPSTIKNILTGKTRKASTIRAIAEAMGVDVATLVIQEKA
jgi:transcriptional regulator with XRE-family HTH domain